MARARASRSADPDGTGRGIDRLAGEGHGLDGRLALPALLRAERADLRGDAGPRLRGRVPPPARPALVPGEYVALASWSPARACRSSLVGHFWLPRLMDTTTPRRRSCPRARTTRMPATSTTTRHDDSRTRALDDRLDAAAIEIEHLHFRYPDGFEALHGVDLSIAAGEKVAIVGPNGAGKSTLLLHLNGIHEPSHGAVRDRRDRRRSIDRPADPGPGRARLPGPGRPAVQPDRLRGRRLRAAAHGRRPRPRSTTASSAPLRPSAWPASSAGCRIG